MLGREREAKRKKNLNKKLAEIDDREEKNWTRNFISSIKNDSEWLRHWDIEEISIHSIEIINKLSNKSNLNDNEKTVLKFAFGLAYPNGL